MPSGSTVKAVGSFRKASTAATVARVDHGTNDLRGTAPGDRRDETRSGVDPSDTTVATVNDVNVTRAVDAHSQRGL